MGIIRCMSSVYLTIRYLYTWDRKSSYTRNLTTSSHQYPAISLAVFIFRSQSSKLASQTTTLKYSMTRNCSLKDSLYASRTASRCASGSLAMKSTESEISWIWEGLKMAGSRRERA